MHRSYQRRWKWLHAAQGLRCGYPTSGPVIHQSYLPAMTILPIVHRSHPLPVQRLIYAIIRRVFQLIKLSGQYQHRSQIIWNFTRSRLSQLISFSLYLPLPLSLFCPAVFCMVIWHSSFTDSFNRPISAFWPFPGIKNDIMAMSVWAAIIGSCFSIIYSIIFNHQASPVKPVRHHNLLRSLPRSFLHRRKCKPYLPVDTSLSTLVLAHKLSLVIAPFPCNTGSTAAHLLYIRPEYRIHMMRTTAEHPPAIINKSLGRNVIVTTVLNPAQRTAPYSGISSISHIGTASAFCFWLLLAFSAYTIISTPSSSSYIKAYAFICITSSFSA
uniref:Putative integrase n=1 Tax=Selenomonas phage M1 TaxID=456243 RepID=O48375_9CAUD|nr:putative integrase [Selenomonas phage M1]